YSATGKDGSFTFHGIPPGKRVLYCRTPGTRDEWMKIQDLEIDDSPIRLGEVLIETGSVSVSVSSDEPSFDQQNQIVQLQYLRPGHFWTRNVGKMSPRRTNNDPYLIEMVPKGKYCLWAGSWTGPTARRVVDYYPEQVANEIAVEIPTGSASISGRCDKENVHGLAFWKRDESLSANIQPEKGEYKVIGLPAGDYVLGKYYLGSQGVIQEFSLSDGESKTLDLDGLQWPPDGSLLCTVYATTEHGGILPGAKVQLEGIRGPIKPVIVRDNRTTFLVKKGAYSIEATYPGFKPETKKVSLMASDGSNDLDGQLVFLEMGRL
ncbi:MAG: carboxypeptidase regulatory-like domain-containing protein, partial [Candidatus Omnitrophica bacterium]|nr:carboxypeptidase regulatory-like domain-containing protein [Candidatus Omnitrophota bacterium]